MYDYKNIYDMWLAYNKSILELNQKMEEEQADRFLAERYSLEVDLLQTIGAPKEEIDAKISNMKELGYEYIPGIMEQIKKEFGKYKGIGDEKGERSPEFERFATKPITHEELAELCTELSSEPKIGKINDYKKHV